MLWLLVWMQIVSGTETRCVYSNGVASFSVIVRGECPLEWR